MTCLDNDAFIAAHQQKPPATSAVYTERIRAFISAAGERVMVPAIVLSEYLFGFEDAERLREVQVVLGRTYFIAPYDRSTAEITASLGRRFAKGRSLGEVARQFGSDRVRLKADLLVVATAVQHRPKRFVSNDDLTLALAECAGLAHYRLRDLPAPTPLSPPPPAAPPAVKGKGGSPSLFGVQDD